MRTATTSGVKRARASSSNSAPIAAAIQTAGGEDDIIDMTEVMERKAAQQPRKQQATMDAFCIPKGQHGDFKAAWATAAAVAGLSTVQVGFLCVFVRVCV